jgi:hypothetical protein
MTDFKKIIDHPEKQIIISKIVSGESPKDISNYLKDKYPKTDEGHLRIPATTLQEFKDKYADHQAYVQKVISNECDSKLDKKIAESLLNNKAWKERLVQVAGEEIDFKQKLKNLLHILEIRAEQVFDLIQANPESTKADYVFTKYMELAMLVIEKGDKLVNEKPDIRIEHTYSVQMVEQQTVAFQEAIRRVLERMGSEYSSIFMDLLNEELSNMNPKEINPAPTKKELEKNRENVTKMLTEAESINSTLEELNK